MKNQNANKIYIILSLILSFCLFSCSQVSDKKTSSIVINLPTSRTLVADDATISSYNNGTYKISILRGGQEEYSKIAKKGETVEFLEIPFGTYKVTGEYFTDSECPKCVAYGYTDNVEVNSDETTNVFLTISLNKVSKIQNVQITDIDELVFESDTDANDYDLGDVKFSVTLENGYTENSLKYSDFKSTFSDFDENLIEITKTVDESSCRVTFDFTKNDEIIYSYKANILLDNITIGETTYDKAGLVPVNFESVTITGSGSDGVFIDGRNVTLSPYAIGKYEVTQQLFEAVMGTNPSKFSSDSAEGETQNLRPVEYVNWYGAIAFCNKLTLKTGGTTDDLCYSVKVDETEVDWASLEYASIPITDDSNWNSATVDLSKKGYRLPTDAEWEFAARGGNQSAEAWNYAYAGTNTVDNVVNVAWCSENSDSKTHEVGLKTPNSLGLYDMCGNVWEWCYDWFSSDISTGEETDPTGALSGSQRVRRGGSWYNAGNIMTVSGRNYNYSPYSLFNSFGFRLARTL